MSFDPLNGNQYFGSVITEASQIPLIAIGNATCSPLNSGLVTSNFLWVNNNPVFSNKKLYSLTCNSSTTFCGLAADVPQFLNKNPGDQASIEVGGPQAVVPAGATIVGAYAVDTGYAGGVLDIGLVQIAGSTPVAHASNIFAGLEEATVNDGGIVVAMPPITGDSDLGSVGDTPLTTVTVGTTGITGVTVTSDANITASTGLKIQIYYLY